MKGGRGPQIRTNGANVSREGEWKKRARSSPASLYRFLDKPTGSPLCLAIVEPTQHDLLEIL